MPTPDDNDPVQDRKAAREATDTPTLGELQQRWREASSSYWTCCRAAEQAKKDETAAREVLEKVEQEFGRAIGSQLASEAFDHQGTALVAVNGLLVRVTRTTGNSPHYYIRPADVVRL